MTSEVEQRIHKALAGHPLERIEHGYRLVHPGAGVSTLRLLPVGAAQEGQQVVAIAEIAAEYEPTGLPSFHPSGVQRLNRMAVYGAYELREEQLRQTAKVSIYANEPAAHLVAQSILNAFGGQLPIGRSAALATISAAVLEQQRAHHAMPREWKKAPDEESLKSAAAALQGQGLAAAHDASSVWAELPMSGDCPSRSIDPRAETALLQVNTSIPTRLPAPDILRRFFCRCRRRRRTRPRFAAASTRWISNISSLRRGSALGACTDRRICRATPAFFRRRKLCLDFKWR